MYDICLCAYEGGLNEGGLNEGGLNEGDIRNTVWMYVRLVCVVKCSIVNACHDMSIPVLLCSYIYRSCCDH